MINNYISYIPFIHLCVYKRWLHLFRSENKFIFSTKATN